MELLLLLVLLLVFGFSALMTTIHSNSARILLVLALLILMAQFLALVHAVVVLSSALVQLDENSHHAMREECAQPSFLLPWQSSWLWIKKKR